jgi:hypothetical protein
MSPSDVDSDVSSNGHVSDNLISGIDDGYTQPYWDGVVHHFTDTPKEDLIEVCPRSPDICDNVLI